MTPRVLIVDDSRIYHQALREALEQRGFAVDEPVETVDDAIQRLRGAPVDLAVLDYELPDGSLLDLHSLIDIRAAARKVVVVTGHTHPAKVRQVMDLGPDAFLSKRLSSAALAEHVMEAYQSDGAAPVMDHDTALLVRDVLRRGGGRPLTNRERDVVELVAAGYGNQQIATRLCVEVSTVKAHLKEASRKLGASNRWECVRKAVDAGFVDL